MLRVEPCRLVEGNRRAMTRTFRDFPRITVDPAVMAGKPCIRGMRVTVGMILGELAAGATPDNLLQEFAYLERDDITEALRFAAWRMQEREIDLAEVV